jgi:hypothetical protein
LLQNRTTVPLKAQDVGTLSAADGFAVIVAKDVSIPKMAQRSDAAKMRQRASRSLDLATRSRCEGRPDYAGLLTDLATEILEHALNVEQRNERGNRSPSVGNWSGTSTPDAA